jgi:hypothetical protein
MNKIWVPFGDQRGKETIHRRLTQLHGAASIPAAFPHGLFRRPPPKPIQLTTGPVHWPSKQLQPFLAGVSAEFVSFSKDDQAVAYVSLPEGILPPGFGLSPGLIKPMLVVTNKGRAIHTVVAEITFPGETMPTLNTTSSDAWNIGCDHDHD